MNRVLLSLCLMVFGAIAAQGQNRVTLMAPNPLSNLFNKPIPQPRTKIALDIDQFWAAVNVPKKTPDYATQNLFTPLRNRPETAPAFHGDITLVNLGVAKLKRERIPCQPNELHCMERYGTIKWWVLNSVNPGFQRSTEETPLTHQRKRKITISITKRF